MSTDRSTRVFTPPRWLNALTRGVLHTPGLQRLVGRSTALITFTGRSSGTVYTTPVTYARRGDKVIMTCDESRQWWRNLKAQPEVGLRLAGSSFTGRARILRGADARADLIEFFADRPMSARASGVERNARGELNVGQVEARLTDTVVVVVDLQADIPTT